MQSLAPVYTVELFPPLSRALSDLLRALEPDAWNRATACGTWSVKDVTAHLLGGNLGRLWAQRDAGPRLPDPDYAALVALINRENDLWVRAARRISPDLLITFLELTDAQLYDYFKSLPPEAPARISVAWAGDAQSPNWFDIAREYTEKWHHQQHIREALGFPLQIEREWLLPVLDTFLRGLPHAYRDVIAAPGTALRIHIQGAAGGTWTLAREDEGWQLYTGAGSNATCVVELDQDLAWRLFTRGVSPEAAEERVRVRGDARLGAGLLNLVAIMA